MPRTTPTDGDLDYALTLVLAAGCGDQPCRPPGLPEEASRVQADILAEEVRWPSPAAMCSSPGRLA